MRGAAGLAIVLVVAVLRAAAAAPTPLPKMTRYRFAEGTVECPRLWDAATEHNIVSGFGCSPPDPSDDERSCAVLVDDRDQSTTAEHEADELIAARTAGSDLWTLVTRRKLTIDKLAAMRVELARADAERKTDEREVDTFIVRGRRVLVVTCTSDGATFDDLVAVFDAIAGSIRLSPLPRSDAGERSRR